MKASDLYIRESISEPEGESSKKKPSGSLFSDSELNHKQKAMFYSELHLMLSAGIELANALEMQVRESKGKVKQILDGILIKLVNGSSFSESLGLVGSFTDYEFYSIKIGEETGMLTTVIEELKTHYENKIKQRRLIMSAISYPILVFVTSIGAVAFMLQVVVPMFENVFARFGNDLPALTKTIISLADLFENYFLLIVLICSSLIAIFWMNRKRSSVRSFLSRLLLALPFFGEVVRAAQLAKMCSAMKLLLRAKNPLVSSLSLVKNMIGFYPIEESLEQIVTDVTAGETLHKSMAKHPIYPRKMIALIEMSEEVNKLELIFEKISDQYNNEVSHKSAIAGNVLEPLMIIFVGSIVSLILVAMFLPLFELNSTIG